MRKYLDAIGAYFVSQVTELEQSISEWPNSKEQLNMPCLSLVTAGAVEYTHGQKVKISQVTVPPEEVEEGEEEIPSNKVTTKYQIGRYEQKIQIDLWCEYKEQRDLILPKILDAFDKSLISGGQFHGNQVTVDGCVASFFFTSYNYLGSEDSSQSAEWRVKIDAIVDYPRVVETTESIMKDITLDYKIDNVVDAENDDTDETKEI